jgi:AraC family transcriptional regulator, transcriptional activator of pobA
MEDLFKIFIVDVAEAERIAQAANTPHHHDYEELIIGREGALEHFIDFRSQYIEAPFVSFVAKGKIHRVNAIPRDGNLSLWVLRFKSEFIPEITFSLYEWYHDQANLQVSSNFCFGRMHALCGMMQDEMKQPAPDLAIIRHLLSALFAMIESERRKSAPDDAGTAKNQSTTFKNFLRILEENFRRPEGVEFYAEKLFMSSRNLNLICQSILQQSVSEIIETRKLIEAKNLLTATDKTVSEIGFELGYQEKSHFTNVFKRRSGQTPTEFRDEMRKLMS